MVLLPRLREGIARGSQAIFLGPAILALLAGATVVVWLAAWDLRPMHADEAGNGISVGLALEGTPFVYDPQDRHGPTWFLLARVIAQITGAIDTPSLETWQIRLPSLLAWLGLLLLIPGWRRVLPGPAPLLAGVWWVAAAPMVYYGNCAIHEPLLVFLTMAAWLIGWGWIAETRPTARLVHAGLLGGVIAAACATKETTVLALLAAGAALVLGLPRAGLRSILVDRRQDLLVLAAVTVMTIFLWFSDGGRHPERLGALLEIPAGTGTRAAGAGHASPWFTYLVWYLMPTVRSDPWSGWLLVIGLVPGAWWAWQQRRGNPLPWILTIYVLMLFGLYSLIPYKTPWLMLQVLVPGALVAGLGWAALGRGILRRVGVLPVILMGTGALAMLFLETRQVVFRWPADPANSLAYAHTVPDAERLAERLVRMPGSQRGPLAVVGGDPWPLPWYLRRCPRVGYWPRTDALPPGGAFRAVVVVGVDDGELDLPPGWSVRPFGLRPGVLAHLYLPPEIP